MKTEIPEGYTSVKDLIEKYTNKPDVKYYKDLEWFPTDKSINDFSNKMAYKNIPPTDTQEGIEKNIAWLNDEDHRNHCMEAIEIGMCDGSDIMETIRCGQEFYYNEEVSFEIDDDVKAVAYSKLSDSGIVAVSNEFIDFIDNIGLKHDGKYLEKVGITPEPYHINYFWSLDDFMGEVNKHISDKGSLADNKDLILNQDRNDVRSAWIELAYKDIDDEGRIMSKFNRYPAGTPLDDILCDLKDGFKVDIDKSDINVSGDVRFLDEKQYKTKDFIQTTLDVEGLYKELASDELLRHPRSLYLESCRISPEKAFTEDGETIYKFGISRPFGALMAAYPFYLSGEPCTVVGASPCEVSIRSVYKGVEREFNISRADFAKMSETFVPDVQPSIGYRCNEIAMATRNEELNDTRTSRDINHDDRS